MNDRKPVDYGAMYRELTAILAQNLPQMDEIYAIGKTISQRPEKGAAVAAAEFMLFCWKSWHLRRIWKNRSTWERIPAILETKILRLA